MEEHRFDLPSEKPGWREILRAIPFATRVVYEADKASTITLVTLAVLEAPANAMSLVALNSLTNGLVAKNVPITMLWAGVFLGIAAYYSLRGYLTTRLQDRQRFRLDVALERRQLEYLISLPYEVLENPKFQILATAYDRRSYAMMNLQATARRLLQSMFGVLGLIAILAYIPWQAVAVVVAAQILMGVLYSRTGRQSWSVLQMETRDGRRGMYYGGVISQPVALLAAKMLGLADAFLKRWKRIAGKLLALRIQESRTSANAGGAGEVVEWTGFAAGLWLTLRSVLAGALPLGSAMVFVNGFRYLSNNLATFAEQFRFFQREAIFLPLMQRFFSAEPEADRGRTVPDEPLRIAFEDVWFRYPGSSEDVLRGVSFSFTEGDHIALAGLNGAGKSTLFKLLTRLYEPTRGRITVNGINLSAVKPSAWRKTLSVMLQSDAEWSDTVRNLVRYGALDEPEDRARLREALSVSGLGAVAKELPRGVETHAGKFYAMPEDEAVELSGGQKQLTAVARTLYRDARLYVFDEPTSSVDAEKEEHFFAAVPETLAGKSVIFVSHRFSTLRRAKRILVMDGGRIIEDGTHDELLAKRGRYAELFTLQARLYQ